MSETPATPAQVTILDTPAPTPTPETPVVDTPVTPAPAEDTPVVPAPAEPAKASFPENWRETLSGGDEKRLKQLQRYSDLTAFANKTFALEAKLSSGEYKRDLPKDAKPEDVAEWRKEQGIPDKPEDYKVELPNGVVLGEADKPVVDDFKKFGFDNNLRPEVLNKTLEWYYAKQDAVQKAQEAHDVTYHEELKDTLMSEWGLKDYRTNIAAMASVRDQMPAGLADRILAGRTADGKLVGDDPTFLKWFATVSRELNPHATVVGMDSGKTVESELDTIRKMRREDPAKYDQDKQVQARELELLTVQQKSKARQG